jgi:DNA-binding transcriptional MerR regulator
MDELVERVREALAAEYPGAPNGRVRDVPDRRAIRWYTTIGLVDRPLGMRGRTALYGPRHLQQLVTIKRWQAEGRSLAQIQADFAWLSPEGLADASRVPGQLLAAGENGGGPPAARPDVVVRPRFWADSPTRSAPEPALTTPASLGLTATDIDTAAAGEHAGTTAAAGEHAGTTAVAGEHAGTTAVAGTHAGTTGFETGTPASVHGVTLGRGAILLLPRPVNDRDRDDIAAAAAPLLRLLESRGLIDGRTP